MKRQRSFFSLQWLCVAAALSGCASATDATHDGVGSSEDELIGGRIGAVFTESNAAGGNEVLVFRRAADGSLQRAAAYATTGLGSGDGLGSQGAVVLSDDRRWLYAVNAGSNEVSTFSVRGESLYLVDVVASGGGRPISLTARGDLVYVLNAGGVANHLAGFRQTYDGHLVAIAASERPLSAASVGPAQISFGAGGRVLLVTEKMTNKIDEYKVDLATGRATGPTVHASTGQTPFGFAFTRRGQAIVSEAFGGAPKKGALSSYALAGSNGFANVSASVPSGESAPCWVVLTGNDRLAYVSNTASGSISTYQVSVDGRVALADDRPAITTGDGSKPIDMARSRGERFLHVLESGTARLGAFRVDSNGALKALSETPALPSTAVGLAAL
ncbi:MAG: hypothetical protein NVS3B20_23350 [Polyangiales bacterium]